MPNAGMDADVFERFIEQLKRYVRERLVPAEDEVIELNRVPEAILAEMRDMGLFGVTIPEEYGGAGVNVSQYARFVAELSWALPAFRSVVSINIGMAASALMKSGDDEQRRHWLPRLAAGEIACFGLTEPDSGSDAAAL